MGGNEWFWTITVVGGSVLFTVGIWWFNGKKWQG